MKKSADILGLPIISITEGRELGTSKTLLIDAANGSVAAITIEDADWYRGVKLLPYDSVIAIGDDAITITNSENILTLENAGDYESMLDANIRVIGTKAITKTGTIQGKVTEIFVGVNSDNGKIKKCEITTPEGSQTEISADEISIFGKEVTIIDSNSMEKKTESLTPAPAQAPSPAPKAEEAKPAEPAAPAVKPEEPKAEPKPAVKPAVKAEEKKPEHKAEEKKVPAPKAEEKPEVKAEAKPEAKHEDKKEEKKQEKPAEPKTAEKPEVKIPAAPVAPAPQDNKQQLADKETEDRHRRFLLGKKATRRIESDKGVVIVDAGEEITEAVLQKAKLANKFIELSMNIQA